MSKKEKSQDKVELVLLRTTTDEFQLNLIRGLLEEAEIPYIVKERGIGGYMKIIAGSSLYGTDIYVDKTSFEAAETVLDALELEYDE